MAINILLDNNNKFREFTGVNKFHQQGYFGQNVIAASGEYFDINYNIDDLIYDPLNKTTINDHGLQTAATFFQVAPKSKLFMLPSVQGSYSGNNIDYTNDFLNQSVKIIQKYNITNMFVSLVGTRHKKYYSDLSYWLQQNNNFKYFWAAGNEGNYSANPMLEINEIIGVGAYQLLDDNTIRKMGYSSESKYLDFMAPSFTYTNPDAKYSNDVSGLNGGTSFSTPWLCGMACLVDDFFISKTGKPLTRAKMMEFFIDNCIDMNDIGFDQLTGYGAVILPDPLSIDIEKYQKIKDDIMYKDENTISSWAKNDVEYCQQHELMLGDSNQNFRPKDFVTREELACVIARLHKQVNK